MGERPSDQKFDNEFIKVFVRIRPEYNKLANDIGFNEVPTIQKSVIAENGREKTPSSPTVVKKSESPSRSASLTSTEKVKIGY